MALTAWIALAEVGDEAAAVREFLRTPDAVPTLRWALRHPAGSKNRERAQALVDRLPDNLRQALQQAASTAGRPGGGSAQTSGGPGGDLEAEEYERTRARVIRSIRGCWISERSVVAVLRKLVDELGPSDDRAGTAFQVVTYMARGFGIPLAVAGRFTRWHVVGGDLSDEETERRFEGVIHWPPDGRGAVGTVSGQ
ncbi:hypothetical protein ACFV1L_22705 [Kitasatospora sp. NPDC059646]|uniref:hypothetical protein n=1 Tax=Kitasatospora sp. NPDC059646 TaxID=3346893 RepID=UPI0036C4B341